MEERVLKKLRDFIAVRFGIYIDDSKLLSIYTRKLKKLMEKFGYTSLYDFYRDIVFEKNPELINALIETITVNETYFFREEYQFEVLAKHILPELHRIRPKDETINILSAPCSTGEEVYSIAIYILEEGRIIKERDIMLLGIDIDKSAIEKAKKGIYPPRSVQKVPAHILSKYFERVGNYYKVKDFLREAVNFKVANVLDKYQMKRLGKFDVIFSRNMLIYFDEKTRREVLANFYNILKPNGYLFLGHAEKIPAGLTLFKQVKIGNVYLYKKEK